MIDKSHTKKDIIEIVETFDFKIEDYSDMTKNYLFKVVETYIDSLESFKGNEHYKDLDSLKEYLRKPNQNRIKIADRDKYIDIAKHIIFYCKNGYVLSYTKYLTEDDLIRDIQMICSFCNLPTCLRAINMINSSGKFKQKFEPITSGKTKVLLRKREEQRLKTLNIMKTRTIEDNGGHRFKITFD